MPERLECEVVEKDRAVTFTFTDVSVLYNMTVCCGGRVSRSGDPPGRSVARIRFISTSAPPTSRRLRPAHLLADRRRHFRFRFLRHVVAQRDDVERDDDDGQVSVCLR